MKKLFLTIIIYLAILMGAVEVSAQNTTVVSEAPVKVNILDVAYDNVLLIIATLVLIGVILAGLNLIWALIEIQKMKLLEKYGPEVLERTKISPTGSLWQKISQKSWNLVAIEKESDIDLGHEYDGIRELDNSLPPWWVWLFYLTIIWAAAYLYYYHVSDQNMNQEQEYVAAIESGEADKAKYLASQADVVDEKTVKQLTEEKLLAEGKEIYVANCLVCHGQNGEGLVGPNFTDKYWIHGGSIKNLFTTIKYGVPEKGMISWKSQLQPSAIQKVASYILSFQGTNPPNQKEAQGILYELTVVASDGTVIDSMGNKNDVKIDLSSTIMKKK